MFKRAFFISVLLAAGAFSAAAEGVTAEQTVERETVGEAADGTDIIVWEPADVAAPGDVLRYAIRYRNSGSQTATDVILAMPVPGEVSYREGSVSGASPAFSADEGKSFAPRGSLFISSDGMPRLAVSEEITHIRWTFPKGISPGAAGIVSFEAVLK